MKRVFLSIIASAAVVATAQVKAVQSGTPALLEAANGKKLKVMLQRLEGDKLTFQPFKSTKDMTVPASKINSLQFFPKYDEEAVNAAFVAGDLEGTLAVLEPLMGEYIQYMPIQNNMRETFVLTYNCYRSIGDFENAEKYASQLMACEDAELQLKGQIGMALIALEKNDIPNAQKLLTELGDEVPAAKLYLKASIERKNGEPKQAIQTVTTLIEDHANDLNWLPPAELLVAYCYLDMTGTNSVISTNSALNTARQVKNMYAGTAVSVNAEKLWTELGGADIEAAEKAEKARQEAIRKEAEEKRLAEQQARKEAKAAEKAVAEAAANETDVSTTTDTTTESE